MGLNARPLQRASSSGPRVLALDPGERVGWAVGHVDSYADGGQNLVLDKHGISFLKDMALAVHRAVVLEDKYDVVVYETWRLRAHKAKSFAGNDMQSSQFIGMVRLCCWLNPRVKLVSQGPSIKATADRTMPDHLRKVIAAAPKEHDLAHDTDAIRHLWHWYWTRYV